MRETRQMGQGTNARNRLVWLDGLRGIAVSGVLLAHILQHWSVYEAYRGDVLQLGLFGVVVFFFSSGYIIPVSAQRYGSFGYFWWSRFWRLYPAYWLSVAAALLWMANGWMAWPAAGGGYAPEVIGWNLSMLASFAEQPLLIGVYWTLSLELLFYALVSVALLLRLLQFPELFAAGLILTSVLLQLFLPAEDAVIFTQWTLFAACLWCGAVAQQVHSGAGSRRKGWAVGLLWLGAVLLQLLLPGTRGMVVAELAAAALALCALVAQPRLLQGIWCWIGRISYSLYLFHLLIVEVLPWTAYPVASGFLAVVLSLASAAVLERCVERPAMALGQRLLARPRGRQRWSQPEAPEQPGAVSPNA